MLLVDADAGRRALSTACGAKVAVGLADVVGGRVSAEDAIIPWPAFAVLPAGEAQSPPPFRRFAAFLAQARQRYDLVLVCVPALAEGGSAMVECEGIDGLVLVASQDDLHRGAFIEAVDAVGTSPGFLGLVLTGASAAADGAFALAG